jgi:hypothetical protein
VLTTPAKIIGKTAVLQVELLAAADQLYVRFVGTIDEDLNFAHLLDPIIGSHALKLNLDLEKVNRINSCGVREWLLFIQELQSQMAVRFVRVSEAFVKQINLIQGMLGPKGAPVLTFAAPYFCEQCDARHVIALKAEEVDPTGKPLRAPIRNCPRCSKPMSFDAMESEYLSFLTKMA